MRILIIEDERKIAEAIKETLQNDKHHVVIQEDGQSGLDDALSNIYDIILLDIMLPSLDGFTIVQEIREHKNFTPVLMLTAKGNVADKVNGLNLGADDYLSKPFDMDELIARIHVLTRRHQDVIKDELLFEDLRLHLKNYTLSRGKKQFRLSQNEFDLMNVLMSQGNSVISRDEILQKCWNMEDGHDYNYVEVYISFLRKKLASLKSKVAIETVRGIGYRLG